MHIYADYSGMITLKYAELALEKQKLQCFVRTGQSRAVVTVKATKCGK